MPSQPSDVVLRKSAQAKTLADLSCKVVGIDSKFPFDSTILFSRLLVIVNRSTDMRSYFAYELTAAPTALFKDPLHLRKTDKSQLARTSEDW